MEFPIRFCTEVGELAQAFGPISHYFGGTEPSGEEFAQLGQTFDYRRALLALDGPDVVGAASSHAYELTVPGGLVPAAGVTIVAVRPTHRRRGILRSLMREQLEQVHAAGEPLAVLWASEETIYGRFGYGMSSLAGEFDLPKAACRFAQPFEPRGQVRLLPEKEAFEPISRIYDRVRPHSPGMCSRTENWWKLRRLADPEKRRKGGVLNRVVLDLEGQPEAYALYRMNQNLEGGVTKGHLRVVEAMATTPEATRQIWHFLFAIDWVASVRADALPLDHPLFFLLARPRLMGFKLGDALWTRLVDVQKALALRQVRAGGPVVLDVRDSFCPWNQGRYRVGAGDVERTDRPPDLSLDVSALGSIYLGGFTFAQLARAGRIEECSENAVARADALFASDRLPWCPEVF